MTFQKDDRVCYSALGLKSLPDIGSYFALAREVGTVVRASANKVIVDWHNGGYDEYRPAELRKCRRDREENISGYAVVHMRIPYPGQAEVIGRVRGIYLSRDNAMEAVRWSEKFEAEQRLHGLKGLGQDHAEAVVKVNRYIERGLTITIPTKGRSFTRAANGHLIVKEPLVGYARSNPISWRGGRCAGRRRRRAPRGPGLPTVLEELRDRVDAARRHLGTRETTLLLLAGPVALRLP